MYTAEIWNMAVSKTSEYIQFKMKMDWACLSDLRLICAELSLFELVFFKVQYTDLSSC